MKYLKKKFFELTSFNEFLTVFIHKDYYEERIDLLTYKNNHCLITDLDNFCKRNKVYSFMKEMFHFIWKPKTNWRPIVKLQ